MAHQVNRFKYLVHVDTIKNDCDVKIKLSINPIQLFRESPRRYSLEQPLSRQRKLYLQMHTVNLNLT